MTFWKRVFRVWKSIGRKPLNKKLPRVRLLRKSKIFYLKIYFINFLTFKNKCLFNILIIFNKENVFNNNWKIMYKISVSKKWTMLIVLKVYILDIAPIKFFIASQTVKMSIKKSADSFSGKNSYLLASMTDWNIISIFFKFFPLLLFESWEIHRVIFSNKFWLCFQIFFRDLIRKKDNYKEKLSVTHFR